MLRQFTRGRYLCDSLQPYRAGSSLIVYGAGRGSVVGGGRQRGGHQDGRYATQSMASQMGTKKATKLANRDAAAEHKKRKAAEKGKKKSIWETPYPEGTSSWNGEATAGRSCNATY